MPLWATHFFVGIRGSTTHFQNQVKETRVTTGDRHSQSRAIPNRMVLPPGEFNVTNPVAHIFWKFHDNSCVFLQRYQQAS